MQKAKEITQSVRKFYEELPFNYFSSSQNTLPSIKENPIIEAYPDLHQILSSNEAESVLEFGCGAGWFTNSVALHYSKRAVGIDMTQKALKRAKEVAKLLDIQKRASFVHSDLFDFESSTPFDLVASIGVLHSTYDARAAFMRIQKFVAPHKYVFVGLYHYYGRKVFLEYFKNILATQGETAAFAKYRSMNPNLRDEEHLRSWFRDQVLHPHETQHTLEEVADWFNEADFSLVSTSINRFEKFETLAELVALEKRYEQLSYQRNIVEGRFFPGFFTVLGVRN